MKKCFLIALTLLLGYKPIFASGDLEQQRREYLMRLGKVFQCDKAKKRLESFVVYETKKSYSLTPIPVLTKDPVAEAKRVFSRLEKIHDTRFQFYTGLLNHLDLFLSEPKEGIELKGKHADTALPPANCKQKTVYRINLNLDQEGELPYNIILDTNLFKQLSIEDQRAILVEMILGMEGSGYEMLEDTVSTRLYAAMLLSKEFDAMDKDSFREFLVEVEFYSIFDFFQ